MCADTLANLAVIIVQWLGLMGCWFSVIWQGVPRRMDSRWYRVICSQALPNGWPVFALPREDGYCSSSITAGVRGQRNESSITSTISSM